MATPAELKNKLAKKEEKTGKKPQTIIELLNSTGMKNQIQKALPKGMDAERIARIALTAVRINPELRECTVESFAAALMVSAQLGLEPNTPLGLAWLIPRINSRKFIDDNGRENRRRVKEVEFQIGYKGTIDLIRRSGMVSAIFAEEVREKDEFEFELGTNPHLKHIPYLAGDRGKVLFYYAVATFKDGGYAFKVMSVDEINKVKTLSPSANSKYSPWNTFFDEMAKKTCIIRMAKYLPLSVEILRGIAQDETVRTNLPEEGEDVLDLPDMNTYIEIEGEEVAASEEEFDDTGKEAAEKLEEPVKIAAFEEQKGSLTGKKPLEK